MTLLEQSAIWLEAIEQGFVQAEDVIQWVDSVIVAMAQPPQWLIELSISPSLHLEDLASRLREQTGDTLSRRRQIQIVILALNVGLISMPTTLSKLFCLVIFEQAGRSSDPLNERLANALAEWDCHENLNEIEPDLQTTFEALFREYAIDVGAIAAVLPCKFQKAA